MQLECECDCCCCFLSILHSNAITSSILHIHCVCFCALFCSLCFLFNFIFVIFPSLKIAILQLIDYDFFCVCILRTSIFPIYLRHFLRFVVKQLIGCVYNEHFYAHAQLKVDVVARTTWAFVCLSVVWILRPPTANTHRG